MPLDANKENRTSWQAAFHSLQNTVFSCLRIQHNPWQRIEFYQPTDGVLRQLLLPTFLLLAEQSVFFKDSSSFKISLLIYHNVDMGILQSMAYGHEPFSNGAADWSIVNPCS